jgi:hypothetical protein
MSALDMLIRRLMAQRACIERGAELVGALAGPAVQLGFGDGAAYDHLRETLRRRAIIVFDRHIAAVPGQAPGGEERVVGDPRETLPLAWDRWRRTAALAHFNTSVTASPRLAAELAPLVAPLLRAGAVVVSEIPLELPGWVSLPLPDGVREGRHHLYRVG